MTVLIEHSHQGEARPQSVQLPPISMRLNGYILAYDTINERSLYACGPGYEGFGERWSLSDGVFSKEHQALQKLRNSEGSYRGYFDPSRKGVAIFQFHHDDDDKEEVHMMLSTDVGATLVQTTGTPPNQCGEHALFAYDQARDVGVCFSPGGIWELDAAGKWQKVSEPPEGVPAEWYDADGRAVWDPVAQKIFFLVLGNDRTFNFYHWDGAALIPLTDDGLSDDEDGPDFQLPSPRRSTFSSGLCTAGIIITTTLAYSFVGVSIVFMMLLMRGGVLVIAPVVDSLTGRKTRWYAWVGLGLSLAALVVAFMEKGGTSLHTLAVVSVALYLLCYFFRLQIMSRKAKSTDRSENIRYFVEEQMVAAPIAFVFLVIIALVLGQTGVEATGVAGFANDVRSGFALISNFKILPAIVVLGLFSQGTGIFGGLVLLHPSENTFSVPVNRSSSIIAGVMASVILWAFFEKSFPSAYQLVGAALIIIAILFLSAPSLMKRFRKIAS